MKINPSLITYRQAKKQANNALFLWLWWGFCSGLMMGVWAK